MTPSPWVAAVLVLAAYRATRLIGWDDLPPVVRLRAWATGETWQVRGRTINDGIGVTDPVNDATVSFRRPLLAHFLNCPYCVGFWVAAAVYVWWLLEPTSCLYAAFPFAASGVVGLVSKNWDA